MIRTSSQRGIMTMCHLRVLVFLLSIYLVAALTQEEQRVAEAKQVLRDVYREVMQMKPEEVTPEFMKQVAHAIHSMPREEFGNEVDYFDSQMRIHHADNPNLLSTMGISAAPPATHSAHRHDTQNPSKPQEDQKQKSGHHLFGRHQKTPQAPQEPAEKVTSLSSQASSSYPPSPTLIQAIKNLNQYYRDRRVDVKKK